MFEVPISHALNKFGFIKLCSFLLSVQFVCAMCTHVHLDTLGTYIIQYVVNLMLTVHDVTHN